MEYNYTKKEYIEAIEKMKESLSGSLEIATIVSNEEDIDKINEVIKAHNILKELLDDDYDHEEFVESIDDIVYTIQDVQNSNKFLLFIIRISNLCKNTIKLHSMKVINREEFDTLILLNDELDKMALNYKENIFYNRGKCKYISQYINKLLDNIKERQSKN